MRALLANVLGASTTLTMLVAPVPALAALGPQAGITAAVRGSVMLAETGRPEAGSSAVNDGTEVRLGNAVRSGEGSGLQLMLLDQTSVTLGENAELAVDEFVYDPNSDVAKLSVGISRGTFRLVTGAISDIDPANTVIRTPTAQIGVRGTILLTRVTPAGSLIALGGPGKETDTRDRVGAVEVTTPLGTVILSRPGFATFVAPGKAPEAPRPLTDEESASLNGDLAKKAGQGMNMAFATPTKGAGDDAGAGRAAGGARVGSVSGSGPCDADLCQRRAPVTNAFSNNTNGTTIDPTLPWSAPDGGSATANNETKNVRNLLMPTLASELAGLRGTATYGATGIPIYMPPDGVIQKQGGSTNGLEKWGYFESLRDAGASSIGTYDFQASVDFDARTLHARYYGGRVFNRVSLPEIGTLSGSFADGSDPVFRSGPIAIPKTTGIAYMAARLMSSRDGDPARVLEQSLVMEQGGSFYGNTTDIYGTATGWAAPNLAFYTSTAEGASWFSGMATYAQTGIVLFGKAGGGTFSIPAGQYDVTATVDFNAREVRETISNLSLPGEAGRFELPALLHAIVTGTKLDYQDIGRAVLDSATGAAAPDLSATVGTRFENDWSDVYDRLHYLRHSLSINRDGQAALQGSARIPGDMSGATYNE